MPFDLRAWRREYDKIWVARRRQECLDYLGGKCHRCGNENSSDLEFDHIDRTAKSFTISQNYNRRWEVLVEELKKCQLLCWSCHRAKTKEYGETGGGHNKRLTCPHGTITGYMKPWRCRCEPCRKAKSEYRSRYSTKKSMPT